MSTKVCAACQARSVRRAHRVRWQRALSFVMPMRPLQCDACGVRSWGLLQSADGMLPWASSMLAWLLVGSFVALLLSAPAARAPAVIVRSGPLQQMASDVALDRDGVDPQMGAGDPGGAPANELLAAPEAGEAEALSEGPAPATEPADLPHSADAGPASRLVLRDLDVRWTGDSMEVRLDAGSMRLSYDVRAYAGVHGYIVDLPGQWTLPAGLRMTRTFTRSNLSRLRIGRHRDHLRLVLTLRKYPSAPPRVERSDDGLRILI